MRRCLFGRGHGSRDTSDPDRARRELECLAVEHRVGIPLDNPAAVRTPTHVQRELVSDENHLRWKNAASDWTGDRGGDSGGDRAGDRGGDRGGDWGGD